MKKVYQKIVDKGHGDCMRAVVASLLELELEEVPNFIELGDLWFPEMHKFFHLRGYTLEGCLYQHNNEMHEIKNYQGINGLFWGGVYSPKYYNPNDSVPVTHAVIIDKNYNIVHDPNPSYQNIKSYPMADKIGNNGVYNVWLFEKITLKGEKDK